jgi:hypothetical protein
MRAGRGARRRYPRPRLWARLCAVGFATRRIGRAHAASSQLWLPLAAVRAVVDSAGTDWVRARMRPTFAVAALANAARVLPGRLERERPRSGTEAQRHRHRLHPRAHERLPRGRQSCDVARPCGLRPQESGPRTLSPVGRLCRGTVAEQQATTRRGDETSPVRLSAWPPRCWRWRWRWPSGWSSLLAQPRRSNLGDHRSVVPASLCAAAARASRRNGATRQK